MLDRNLKQYAKLSPFELKDQLIEVIAVQVADEHGRDAVGIDAPFADRDHRGGATVDQHVAMGRALEVKAGVEAAARSECVATADDGQPHVRPSRSGAKTRPRASV